MFALHAVTQKYLSNLGMKLHVTFVYLKKASSSVKRNLLLTLLHKVGVSSLFVNAVKAIYMKVLSCVGVNGESTETARRD